MSTSVEIKCPECKDASAGVIVLAQNLFEWDCFSCGHKWLETNTARGAKVIKYEQKADVLRDMAADEQRDRTEADRESSDLPIP